MLSGIRIMAGRHGNGRQARFSGQACPVPLALVIALAGFCVAAIAMPVQADMSHMQRFHADAQSDTWMRSLMRPDVGTSCCNLNDCTPTDAEWKGGQWWAMIRGQMTPIPPEKIVRSPLSMDGEAWVCVGTVTIFCFVPPLSSY